MGKTQVYASVIIPAYNSAHTIKECIEALKKQDYSGKYEIIVVDDGSSDDTAKIARNLNVNVLRQKNAGPAKARNIGSKSAKGEIFVFTDADCIAQKNWLSQMIRPFDEKEVVGVQGAYKTKQTSLTARFVQIEIEERYERMRRFSGMLDWIGSYSAAYRKKDFARAGGFDESFPKASGEDPELSYKLAKQGKKLVFNPDAIVYHTHSDSLVKYLRTKYYRAFYRVNLYSKHKDKIVQDSYTTQEIKLQILGFVGGTGFFIGSLALAYFGHATYGFIAIVISTVFTIIGFLSGTPFFIFAFKKDPAAAIFSLVAASLRTVVFALGLAAGYINLKVK